MLLFPGTFWRPRGERRVGESATNVGRTGRCFGAVGLKRFRVLFYAEDNERPVDAKRRGKSHLLHQVSCQAELQRTRKFLLPLRS